MLYNFHVIHKRLDEIEDKVTDYPSLERRMEKLIKEGYNVKYDGKSLIINS
jgi:tetrahydromethanopterin S-methyltransferase subunit G